MGAVAWREERQSLTIDTPSGYFVTSLRYTARLRLKLKRKSVTFASESSSRFEFRPVYPSAEGKKWRRRAGAILILIGVTEVAITRMVMEVTENSRIARESLRYLLSDLRRRRNPFS